MKQLPKLLICALIGSLGCVGESSAQTVPRQDFQWEMPLLRTYESGATYSLTIPNEVFDGAEKFPDDIRIIDASGTLWPFFVLEPQTDSQFEPRELKRLNESWVEGDRPYLRVELEVLGEPAPHNRLRLHTAGSNFVRRVEILGSNDRESWGQVGTGYLIDHQSPSHVRNVELDYTRSDFRYVQCRIFPNARKANEEVKLRSVEVGTWVRPTAGWLTAPLEIVSKTDQSKPGSEKEFQTLECDAGFYNLPLERIRLEIPPGEFARSVRISGRNDSGDAWQVVSNNEIHRLGSSEKTTVGIRGNYRFWKIDLYHFDDPPLKVNQVEAQSRRWSLFFEAKSEERASLYFGAAGVEAATFDLKQRRQDQGTVRGVAQAALSSRQENPEFAEHPSKELTPWVARIAVVLVSLLVLWIVVGMLRRSEDVLESGPKD